MGRYRGPKYRWVEFGKTGEKCMHYRCAGSLPTAVAAIMAAVLAGCVDHGSSGGGPGKVSSQIEIDGSSTVYRLSVGTYELFRDEQPGVKMSINYAGTGGGFTKFMQGKLDIVDASRPIQQNEIEQAKQSGLEYIELPVAFDALTVAVNAGNDWAKELTVAELKKLWEPAAKDKVTRWSQIRAEWPDKKIELFGAGHDSG